MGECGRRLWTIERLGGDGDKRGGKPKGAPISPIYLALSLNIDGQLLSMLHAHLVCCVYVSCRLRWCTIKSLRGEGYMGVCE